jgi:hypothetical protein
MAGTVLPEDWQMTHRSARAVPTRSATGAAVAVGERAQERNDGIDVGLVAEPARTKVALTIIA